MKIKFTRGSQEALFMKTGVSIDKIIQNCQKILVKELNSVNFIKNELFQNFIVNLLRS